MERTQLFDLMGELKLFGMKAAFDEIMATAVKRQHEPQRASLTTAISSRLATTAGASRAEQTITRQPALAPSPQPRPAPTARALPPEPVAQGGQNWTPIGGQIWKPIDTRSVK